MRYQRTGTRVSPWGCFGCVFVGVGEAYPAFLDRRIRLVGRLFGFRCWRVLLCLFASRCLLFVIEYDYFGVFGAGRVRQGWRLRS